MIKNVTKCYKIAIYYEKHFSKYNLIKFVSGITLPSDPNPLFSDEEAGKTNKKLIQSIETF